MKKKITAVFILVCMLCAAFSVPASAEELSYIYDESGLLETVSAAAVTDEWILSTVVAYDFGIQVDILYDTEGYELGEYANIAYGQYGYGRGESGIDGVSLTILLEESGAGTAFMEYVLMFGGRGEALFMSGDAEGYEELVTALDPYLNEYDWPEDTDEAGGRLIDAIDEFVWIVEAVLSQEGTAAPDETEQMPQTGLVIDEAGLFTAAQEAELETRAAALSFAYDCNVTILTVEDMGGGDAEAKARGYYRSLGLDSGSNGSGILLFLSMADRDFALVVLGDGDAYFTKYGLEQIENAFLPGLKDGEYYGSFSAYLDKCGEYLLYESENGKPYDSDNLAGKLLIAIGIPLLIALIFCLISLRQMKSAVRQQLAHVYIPEGGFALTGQEDTFLYRTETRRTIESSSSSRSSGGSSSGRSGKF